MTANNLLQSVLNELIQSMRQDIDRYRRAESARSGQDIGWPCAVEQWLRTQYSGWRRREWRMAVEEAVRMADCGIRSQQGDHFRSSLKDSFSERVSTLSAAPRWKEPRKQEQRVPRYSPTERSRS